MAKCIRVDETVHAVVEDHRRFLESTSGRRVTMNHALRSLLSHRQPGGGPVERREERE